MTAGCAASRRVLARTPVAPLPASSPKRPTGINGRTSAPPEMYLPEVCSFQLPKVCSFRLPLTGNELPSGTPGCLSLFLFTQLSPSAMQKIQRKDKRGEGREREISSKHDGGLVLLEGATDVPVTTAR